jgi:hypothetical protein
MPLPGKELANHSRQHRADGSLAVFFIDGYRAWQHKCRGDVFLEHLVCVFGVADFDDFQRVVMLKAFLRKRRCDIMRVWTRKPFAAVVRSTEPTAWSTDFAVLTVYSNFFIRLHPSSVPGLQD